MFSLSGQNISFDFLSNTAHMVYTVTLSLWFKKLGSTHLSFKRVRRQKKNPIHTHLGYLLQELAPLTVTQVWHISNLNCPVAFQILLFAVPLHDKFLSNFVLSFKVMTVPVSYCLSNLSSISDYFFLWNYFCDSLLQSFQYLKAPLKQKQNKEHEFHVQSLHLIPTL